MLSQTDNDYVTQVGPGTPMGALFREYWLPAALSSELPHADCDPLRVMLLGEQLIGFRDSTGKVGLVQNLCPHRGASLFFGRNEEGGLRCVYHGWKFDTTGQCVDMPNEPPESNFKTKIKAVAYPTEERCGIIWAYMGPRELPPALPGFEAFDLADAEWESGAAMRDANWLQGLEGDLDTSHVSFLHSGATKPEDAEEGSPQYYMALHKDPKYVSLDTDFGAMYGAYRPAGDDAFYWRIAQFLFPCHAHIPSAGAIQTRMWVPMDDGHTMFYIMRKKPTGSGPGQVPVSEGLLSTVNPENTTDWYGRFRLFPEMSNDYLIDRAAQREMRSFSGIAGGAFPQDQAVTETMGSTLNRTVEHLGTSDIMVIRIRRRLIEAARALEEHKVAPPGVEHPEVFATRSATIVLPRDADWLEGTKEMRQES